MVTLAGLLACNGLVIWILGSGGTLPISDNVINDLANGCLTPTAELAAHGGHRRRVRGRHHPP